MEHKQKNYEKIIEHYKLIVTFNICNGGGELEGQGHGPRQSVGCNAPCSSVDIFLIFLFKKKEAKQWNSHEHFY